MKMTKLLASGIAASLAVTSLAAVASATERTFEMGHTQGTIKLASSKGYELGDQYSLSQADIDAGKTLGVSDDGKIVLSSVGVKDADKITGVTLKVTGIKGTRSSSSKVYNYKFTQYNDAACTDQNYDGTGKYFKLDVFATRGELDQFVPSQFVEITKIEVEATAEKTVKTAKEYDEWGNSTWGSYNGASVTMDWDNTNAGWKSKGIAQDVVDLVGSLWGYNYASEKSTTDLYPFLALTDDNGNKTLERAEIKILSYSDRYGATTGGIGGGQDGNQSYDEGDYNKGTNPKDFAGLASQVGDFFNKQTNGKITFTFTTSSGESNTVWNNGGVPSTQVGIKNALGDATANDFVLNVNYNQTGSLQAVAAVDAAAGEVSFDISDILDALDGKTIGVIDNIYYGSTKGVTYSGSHPYAGKTGFEVQKITLSYDEDEAGDNDIEEDDDDTDDTDDTDDVDDDTDDTDDVDDDTDDTADDDDDDADDDVSVDDDDDDDDDSDVGGNTNTPVVDPADDGNPPTGVALAVIPAMVAAAAVVVSKKRK